MTVRQWSHHGDNARPQVKKQRGLRLRDPATKHGYLSARAPSRQCLAANQSKQWKRRLRLRDTAGPSAGSSHPLVEAITGTPGINDQTAWGRRCGLDFGPPISSQHGGA